MRGLRLPHSQLDGLWFHFVFTQRVGNPSSDDSIRRNEESPQQSARTEPPQPESRPECPATCGRTAVEPIPRLGQERVSGQLNNLPTSTTRSSPAATCASVPDTTSSLSNPESTRELLNYLETRLEKAKKKFLKESVTGPSQTTKMRRTFAWKTNPTERQRYNWWSRYGEDYLSKQTLKAPRFCSSR